MTRFAGGPVESPGFLLWHATLRWQRAVALALQPLHLTHVQFVLLACTYWAGRSGETPNQASVAAQAGTDPKMTSEVIGRLETKGLVTRVADPRDARAKLLEVTAEGASLARRAIVVVENIDAEFFGAAPDPRLTRALQHVAGLTT